MTGNRTATITTERLLLFGSEFMTEDTKERILKTALFEAMYNELPPR
uniref:Uncharacterized protein n=1 Tax=Myoviridae sp. ctdWz11 TaxID=2826671 RepID=A0A8S5NPA9_9CAUD|nr:MAG TPA: hypothetical protein [Myoviridae sp. ctdWz11]